MLKRTLFVFGAVALLTSLVLIDLAVSDSSSASSTRPAHRDTMQANESRPTVQPPTLDFEHDLSKAISLTDPMETQLAIRSALEKSGPSSAPWTTNAKSSISAWEQQIGAAGSAAEDLVRVGSVQCYAGGCIVPVTFPSARVFDLKSESLMFAPDVTHWTGPAVRSSQLNEADGTVTVE